MLVVASGMSSAAPNKTPPSTTPTPTTNTCNSSANNSGATTDNASTPDNGTPSGQTASCPSCETSGFSLAWILCPVDEGLATLTTDLYTQVAQPLLKPQPITLDDTSQDHLHTFHIWSVLRVYSEILLVVALIAMVYYTSIGSDRFSAYSIKKILPRLLAAAILISLSIYLVAVVVDVGNVVGSGIAKGMNAPFKQELSQSGAVYVSLDGATAASSGNSSTCDTGSTTTTDNSNPNDATTTDQSNSNQDGTTTTCTCSDGTTASTSDQAQNSDSEASNTCSTGSTTGALTGNLGLTGVMTSQIWSWGLGATFLVTLLMLLAGLAMVGLLFVALLRSGMIILGVFSAPLAFACYSLPNTEKYFQKWWELLLRAVFIYPIIAVLFAIGNVLSIAVTALLKGSDASIIQVFATAGLFIPMVLIPFSFRWSGNLSAALSAATAYAGRRLSGDKTGKAGEKADAQDEESADNRRKPSTPKPKPQPFKSLPINAKHMTVFPENYRHLALDKKGQLRQMLKVGQRADAGTPDSPSPQSLLATANPAAAEKRRNFAAKKMAEAQRSGNSSLMQKAASEMKTWEQAIVSAKKVEPGGMVKMQAVHALVSQGNQFSSGQEGYNELATAVAAATGVAEEDLVKDHNGNIVGANGPNAIKYAKAMDMEQLAAQHAGRFDLGAINSGRGYSFVGGLNSTGYIEGHATTKTYVAGAAYFLGINPDGAEKETTPEVPDFSQQLAHNLDSGQTSAESVAKWYTILLDAQVRVKETQSKAEINKQLKAINKLKDEPSSGSSHSWLHSLKQLLEDAAQYLKEPVGQDSANETESADHQAASK